MILTKLKSRVQSTIILEHKNESIEVIHSSSEKLLFLPNFDLEKPLQLLIQFNNCTTEDGNKLYSLWQYKGYYIYPALQNWLYWTLFYPLVKHQSSWNHIRGLSVAFKESQPLCQRALFGLHSAIHRTRSSGWRFLYNSAITTLRQLSAPNHPVVVIDDGRHGFRYQTFKERLGQITPYSRYDIPHGYSDLTSLFRQKDQLVGGYKAVYYPTAPHIDYKRCSFLHPYLSEKEFKKLMMSIHCHCYDKIQEARVLDSYISKLNIKLLCGYDQIEDALAMVIACRLKGIPVVTYQHGLFTRYHTGWTAPGIPKKYCNASPDLLVTWGEYWRDQLLRYSNKYHQDNLLVGSHIRENIRKAYDSPKIPTHPLTVLLPFEFLADNITLSRYIRKFLDFGWKVIIKVRPIGSGNPDIDCHAFDLDVRCRILYKYNLTLEDIHEIDVVAFTHSTFGFEMMPYRKVLWHLETNLRFLEVVEEGWAYGISEDLVNRMVDHNLLKNYLKPLYSNEDIQKLFSTQSLADNLHEILDYVVKQGKSLSDFKTSKG